MLIESGADVNAQDPRGYAPLHWAAFKNYHEVVQLLLQRGAFVNIQSASGLTPLLQASARGALPSMKLLLRWGADVNEPTAKAGPAAPQGGGERFRQGRRAAQR